MSVKDGKQDLGRCLSWQSACCARMKTWVQSLTLKLKMLDLAVDVYNPSAIEVEIPGTWVSSMLSEILYPKLVGSG